MCRLPCVAKRTPFAWSRTVGVDQGGQPLQGRVSVTRGVLKVLATKEPEQHYRLVPLGRSVRFFKFCNLHPWYLYSRRPVYSIDRLPDAAESLQC